MKPQKPAGVGVVWPYGGGNKDCGGRVMRGFGGFCEKAGVR